MPRSPYDLRLLKQLAACVLFFTVAGLAGAADTVIHSIFNPSTTLQRDARQGTNVAMDNAFVVTGAPREIHGIGGQGVVKVYDRATGTLLHTMPNPVWEPGTSYAFSIALSDGLLAVGASREADEGPSNVVGKVYLYRLGSATPTVPVAVLQSPSENVDDRFGNAVAVANERVVVGAPRDATGAEDAGCVYVFNFAGGIPTAPEAILHHPAPSRGAFFGMAVAVSGTRVVVGAPLDGTVLRDAGRAYVYDISTLTPTVPQFTLARTNPAVRDLFGAAVAVSGQRVIVGAPLDDSAGPDAGRVYTYDLSTATPTLLVLDDPSPADRGRFGFAVAASQAQVVVGDPGSNFSPGSGPGHTYVYDFAAADPVASVRELTNPHPGDNDYFGASVAATAGAVTVGAPGDDAAIEGAGAAYLYELGGATPSTPAFTLNATSLNVGDGFGRTVALAGKWMVVGAYDESGSKVSEGRAYAYDLSSATPTVPAVVLTNPSPLGSDYFGQAIAISGSRVVIGAPYHSGSGPMAGSAYVFDLESATPSVPIAVLDNPTPSAGQGFATSVAISGMRVAIGFPTDMTGTASTGSVWLYDLEAGNSPVPGAPLRGPGYFAYFGTSVAMSGDKLAVSCTGEGTSSGASGTVRVYHLPSTNQPIIVARWENPSPASDYGDFGRQVAMSGSRVVVGAPFAGTGRAFVFDLSAATPAVPVATLEKPIPEYNDYFGASVAISGSRVVVGAMLDKTAAESGGIVFVYDLDATSPAIPGQVLIDPHAAPYASFGESVAIDGLTAASGSMTGSTDAARRGAAYVFGVTGTTLPPFLTSPAAGASVKNPVNVTFTLPAAALNGMATLTFEGASTHVLSLNLGLGQARQYNFSFNPAQPAGLSNGVTVSGAAIPEGTYTVTLSYQDTAGNPAGNASSANVTIDTTPPVIVTPVPPQTVIADATGHAEFLNYSSLLEATDNVGVTVKRQTTLAFSPLGLGTRTISFSVHDAAGNITTSQTTLTVRFAPVEMTEATIVAAAAPAGSPAPAGPPDGTLLKGFGAPAIDDYRNMVARVAMVSGRTKLEGIEFQRNVGAPWLVAFQGMDAPGIDGSTFKNFSDPVMAQGRRLVSLPAQNPVITPSIAFTGKVQGRVKPTDDEGVWTDAFGGGLKLVLREGHDVLGQGLTLKSVTSLSLRDSQLLALVQLAPAKGLVTAADDTVLMRLKGSTSFPQGTTFGAKVLLREGRELKGFAGSKIKSFSVLQPAQGSPGHGRWHGGDMVVAKVTLTDGRVLLVKIDGEGAVTPLLSTADPTTPVGQQTQWESFGFPGMGRDGAEFAVAATLKLQPGVVTAKNDAALLISHDGTAWEIFARENDPAPIAGVAEAPRYAAFFDPMVNAAGEVAFLATLQGAGVEAGNKTALFCGPSDHLRLAARIGDAVPDEDGDATAAVWSKFISCALPSGDAAGAVFLGETSGGDTSAKNKLSLWAVDSAGTLRQLLRTGVPLTDGGPALSDLTLLDAVNGAFGAVRSYNSTGSLAVLATFADNSQAMLRLDIP